MVGLNSTLVWQSALATLYLYNCVAEIKLALARIAKLTRRQNVIKKEWWVFSRPSLEIGFRWAQFWSGNWVLIARKQFIIMFVEERELFAPESNQECSVNYCADEAALQWFPVRWLKSKLRRGKRSQHTWSTVELGQTPEVCGEPPLVV